MDGISEKTRAAVRGAEFAQLRYISGTIYNIMKSAHHIVNSVLITGGTGSFGKKFVKTLYERFPKIKRVVIYSRDELKQSEMAVSYRNKESVRFFLGDVRDGNRLKQAMEGIDTVVHAAALKQVPAAEYNPFEAIKTNVLGAQNVIEAALATGVSRVVALSTDKAAAPINLYGATKLCSDKLFVAANNMKGSRDIMFSVVRYGNVMGSRGSVIPFFIKMARTGVLPITDDRMTRFNISLKEGVNLVFYALEKMWGGEIFVPKIPSFRITEVAKAIGPECQTEIIGIRPGEKLHEEMITVSDSSTTVDLGDYYAILPQSYHYTLDEFCEANDARRVADGFYYRSDENSCWLSASELSQMVDEEMTNE